MGSKLERLFAEVNDGRVAFAIFACPLAPILVMTLAGATYFGWHEYFRTLFTAGLIIGGPGYLIECFLGLPLFLLYQYLGWRQAVAYLAGGTSIGLLVCYWLTRASSWPHWAYTWRSYFLCGLYGGLSAFTFWLIVFGRPKRKHESELSQIGY